MKLLQFILGLALFITVISSCGEDDDAVLDPATIIGTWSLTDVDYNAVLDSAVTTVAYDTVFGLPYDSLIYEQLEYIIINGTGDNMNATITFSENPNTSGTTGTFDINAVSTSMGQTTNTTFLDNILNVNGTWSRSSDDIIIRDGISFVNAFKLVEVTATALKLSYEFILVYGDEITDERSYYITQKINIDYTFTK
jgi:hypothetical protein